MAALGVGAGAFEGDEQRKQDKLRAAALSRGGGGGGIAQKSLSDQVYEHNKEGYTHTGGKGGTGDPALEEKAREFNLSQQNAWDNEEANRQLEREKMNAAKGGAGAGASAATGGAAGQQSTARPEDASFSTDRVNSWEDALNKQKYDQNEMMLQQIRDSQAKDLQAYKERQNYFRGTMGQVLEGCFGADSPGFLTQSSVGSIRQQDGFQNFVGARRDTDGYGNDICVMQFQGDDGTVTEQQVPTSMVGFFKQDRNGFLNGDSDAYKSYSTGGRSSRKTAGAGSPYASATTGGGGFDAGTAKSLGELAKTLSELSATADDPKVKASIMGAVQNISGYISSSLGGGAAVKKNGLFGQPSGGGPKAAAGARQQPYEESTGYSAGTGSGINGFQYTRSPRAGERVYVSVPGDDGKPIRSQAMSLGDTEHGYKLIDIGKDGAWAQFEKGGKVYTIGSDGTEMRDMPAGSNGKSMVTGTLDFSLAQEGSYLANAAATIGQEKDAARRSLGMRRLSGAVDAVAKAHDVDANDVLADNSYRDEIKAQMAKMAAEGKTQNAPASGSAKPDKAEAPTSTIRPVPTSHGTTPVSSTNANNDKPDHAPSNEKDATGETHGNIGNPHYAQLEKKYGIISTVSQKDNKPEFVSNEEWAAFLKKYPYTTAKKVQYHSGEMKNEDGLFESSGEIYADSIEKLKAFMERREKEPRHNSVKTLRSHFS